jgi:hypothetical protein
MLDVQRLTITTGIVGNAITWWRNTAKLAAVEARLRIRCGMADLLVT